MRPPVPIDRRLSETKPSTASEALLISVVQKHKNGPEPSLPTSTLARIGRTLGEHPPRLSPIPVWRVAQTFVAVLAALASVEAVAVVGIHVVEIVKVHLAQKKVERPAIRQGLLKASRDPQVSADSAPLPSPVDHPGAVRSDSVRSRPNFPLPPTLASPEERRFIQSAAVDLPHGSASVAARQPSNSRAVAPAPVPCAPSVTGHSGPGVITSATGPIEASPTPPVVLASPLAGAIATFAVGSQPQSLPPIGAPAVAGGASPPARSAAPSPAPSPAAWPDPRSQGSPTPDPLDVEAAQLRSGLELKQAGSLVSAVAALESYRRAYPRGTFWVEATIAELDAQLALGHREDALSLLEQAGDDPSLPRSAELRLLRAELSARQGRCSEALAGFEALLQVPGLTGRALAERALYGRASCQQALGRFSESRSDYEEYLSRYPHGPLATEARRALGLPR